MSPDPDAPDRPFRNSEVAVSIVGTARSPVDDSPSVATPSASAFNVAPLTFSRASTSNSATSSRISTTSSNPFDSTSTNAVGDFTCLTRCVVG